MITTIESVDAKVDKLRDTILEYHEDIRKERETDRIKMAKIEKDIEKHDEHLEKMLRKHSPSPSSLRVGSAPWDPMKVAQAVGALLTILGMLGFSIAKSGNAQAAAEATREATMKSDGERRNELLRAFTIISRSAQSQAKSAEAMISPDPAAAVEAELEAVAVAQQAVEVEHDLVRRQIQVAPTPAVRQQAERSLVDVQARAKKIGAEL